MLRNPEPYMPSFGQVITQNTGTVLRLPAYRSSYQTRYHPYPRCNQRLPRDPFMDTVDYRSDDTLRPFSFVVNPIKEDPIKEEKGIGEETVIVENVEKLGEHVRRLSNVITDLVLRLRVKLMWERDIPFKF